MAKQASRRWWLTRNGRELVPDGHPSAYALAIAPAMDVPPHLADMYERALAKFGSAKSGGKGKPKRGKRAKAAAVAPPEIAAGK